MREIKFRQYYEGDDDSYPEWNYFDLRQGHMVIDGGWKDPQQFTGLKDKNGKEIYEGDIVRSNVKTKWTDYPIFTVEWEQKTTQYVLRKPNNVDGFYGLEQSDIKSPKNDNLEIIGNIYENSELLK